MSNLPHVRSVASIISLMLDRSVLNAANLSKQELCKISRRSKLHSFWLDRLVIALEAQDITIYKGKLGSNIFVVVRT